MMKRGRAGRGTRGRRRRRTVVRFAMWSGAGGDGGKRRRTPPRRPRRHRARRDDPALPAIAELHAAAEHLVAQLRRREEHQQPRRATRLAGAADHTTSAERSRRVPSCRLSGPDPTGLDLGDDHHPRASRHSVSQASRRSPLPTTGLLVLLLIPSTPCCGFAFAAAVPTVRASLRQGGHPTLILDHFARHLVQLRTGHRQERKAEVCPRDPPEDHECPRSQCRAPEVACTLG